MPAAVTQVAQVFASPATLDFRASSLIPAGYGVTPAVLAAFEAKRAEYGFSPAPAPTRVDPVYLAALKAAIFRSWPAASPDVPADLLLVDAETGFCYRYADRADYPGAPTSGTLCP
jgi:hypothetical protein